MLCQVTAVLDNGLQISYGPNKMTGYIHKDLLPPKNTDHKSYRVGEDIFARTVLMVPTLNAYLLSARPVWPISANRISYIQVGELCKSATVTDVMNDQLSLELKPGVPGCAPAIYAQVSVHDTNKLKEMYR